MYIADLRRCAEIFGAMLEFLIKLCIFFQSGFNGDYVDK